MRRGEPRAKCPKRGARTRAGTTKTKLRGGRKDASSAALAKKRAAQALELNRTDKPEALANGDESAAALKRSLADAYRREAATAEVLRVISRSTFDLQAVFDTLVQSAARLCDADLAAIARQKGSAYQAVANYGHTPEEWQVITNSPLAVGPGTATGRAIREGRPIHVRDMWADPEIHLDTFEKAKATRAHTALCVPPGRRCRAQGHSRRLSGPRLRPRLQAHRRASDAYHQHSAEIAAFESDPTRPSIFGGRVTMSDKDVAGARRARLAPRSNL